MGLVARYMFYDLINGFKRVHYTTRFYRRK